MKKNKLIIKKKKKKKSLDVEIYGIIGRSV